MVVLVTNYYQPYNYFKTENTEQLFSFTDQYPVPCLSSPLLLFQFCPLSYNMAISLSDSTSPALCFVVKFLDR